VLLRTGPWCAFFGRFHTTRWTPALATTEPPAPSIRLSSIGQSGLCS
jgi:hypothetical protein